MKIVLTALLLAVSVMMTALAQVDGHTELLSAKYTGNSDVSRLVFSFNKPCTFIHQMLSPTVLRLSFPTARSEKYSNRIPLIFKSGHAKSVVFDFSREDTLAAIVTLNKETQYDLRAQGGKTSVVLEMYSASSAKASAPVVDIKAMINEQVSKAQEQVSTASGLEDFSLVSFVVSFVASALSTALMMYLLFGKVSKANVVAAQPKPQTVGSSSGVEAILAQARLVLQEKSRLNQFDPAGKTTFAEPEDSAMLLARRFRRGHGELQLARTLESKNREYPWEKKLSRLDTDPAGKGVVATAKKLGVGKGELNLALSLRRVQQEQVRKERAK